MSQDELDEIRKKKLKELQNQAAMQQQQQAMQEKVEAQKQLIMRKILSQEARQRLTNIKMVRPQFADAVEAQLIQLAQMGQINRLGIPLPISDENFKEILSQISNKDKKRDFRIKKI
ncbi:MAG: DNA-binding protein [Candidatus Hodarchaeota archaeon]